MTKIAARRDGNHLSVLAFARPRFEQSSSYGNKGLQKIILWVVNRPLFPRLHNGGSEAPTAFEPNLSPGLPGGEHSERYKPFRLDSV